MRRYYELVVSGRQLAGLLAALALLLLLAFVLGVGVGFLQGRGGELAGSGTEGQRVVLGAEGSWRAKPGFAEPVPSPSPEPVSQLATAVEDSPTAVPSPAEGEPVTKPPTAAPFPSEQGRVTGEAGFDEPSLAGRSEAVPGGEPAAGGRAAGVRPETGSRVRARRGEGDAADAPRERWVQVAALSQRSDAEGVRHRVIALGFRPEQVVVLPREGGKYRVRVGPFPDRESGHRVAARLRAGGFPQAFVVSP